MKHFFLKQYTVASKIAMVLNNFLKKFTIGTLKNTLGAHESY